MGQESSVNAEHLRDSMSETRRSIGRTVDQLRRRVRSTTDWRSYIGRHPLPTLGLAVVGGLLAGRAAASAAGGDRPPGPGAAWAGRATGGDPSVVGAAGPRALHGSWSRARSRAEAIVDRVIDGTGDAVESIVVPALLDRLAEILGGPRRHREGPPVGPTGRS